MSEMPFIRKLPIDSKFSKRFPSQIRLYIDPLMKFFTKTMANPTKLTRSQREFLWLLISFFVNKRAGLNMDIKDIKQRYYRKSKSSQLNNANRIKKRAMKKLKYH